MKIVREALLLSILAMVLGGCSEDNPWSGSQGKGGIDLQLSASADVTDAIPVVRSGMPELVAPDVEDFGIELRNMDTDQSMIWQSLEDFHKEGGFDVGNYTLRAFYGNEKECGFDKPCFIGEASVNVLEGRESRVEVKATLANAMISIEYTDAFVNYFTDFSVTAHTEGHANVEFGRNETRAGFVAPGHVALQVSVTNPSGKTAVITPAGFTAKAQHHYHVKFDVNADPVEGAILSVIFDDSLTQEDVKFTLTDELYNTDPPVVEADGFVSGEVVESLSGNSAPNPVKFKAICKSGFKKAILKIAQVGGDKPFNPPFDSELDLMQADEATQYQLQQYGIKVAGLFRNPQQMAIVDLTDLPSHLPEGTFEITFTVTDTLDRDNIEPIVLYLSTLPIELSFISGSAVYEYCGAAITTTPTIDATVTVSYNGLNPEKCIAFKNLCRTGIYKDCKIESVVESKATRGFPRKTYIFNIKVCDVENSPLPMQMWFNGEKYRDGDFTIDVIEPVYSLEVDKFATFAKFRVITDNASDKPTIVNGLTFYNGSKAIDKSLVTTDPEKGILIVEGLSAATPYTIGYSLTKKASGIPEKHTLSFTTEAATNVPNGNFSETPVEDINIPEIQSGGNYSGTRLNNPTYHYLSSIVRNMPAGEWTSINRKTCYTGSTNKNTWFMVPSTFQENGQVIIRSVGYNHSGTTPATYAQTAVYYNPNAPTFTDANKVAGELFLGEYNYTSGKESRNEGYPFSTRPQYLTFDYKYTPVGNEKGYVEISVLDAGNNVIASGSSDLINTENEMRKMTVTISGYNEFGVKAASIRVKFKSSKSSVPAIVIPTGDALNEYKLHNIGNGLRNNTLSANSYHAYASGSELVIDNLKLNY